MTRPAPAETLGLRERKRRATSRSIQISVLRLAAVRGLQHVTVEEISRDADVSPRTFFNYFPSKEAAMLGENPLVVQPGLIEDFVRGGADGDIIDGLRQLMQQMALLATTDRELHQLRREVLRDYPELFAVRVAGMREFEAVLTETVERRLEESSTRAAATPLSGPHAAQARLTALVGIATMRHAFTLWAEAVDEESLSQKLEESFGLLRRVL